MNTLVLEPSRCSPLKSPRSAAKRGSGVTNGGRPPSGKSTVSIVTPGRCSLDHSADSSTIGEFKGESVHNNNYYSGTKINDPDTVISDPVTVISI